MPTLSEAMREFDAGKQLAWDYICGRAEDFDPKDITYWFAKGFVEEVQEYGWAHVDGCLERSILWV